MDKKDTNLIKDIRNNWIIIVFIASIIIGWTTFNNRLGAVEVQADNNSSALQSIQKMQIDIATMKVDINYIKTNLNK